MNQRLVRAATSLIAFAACSGCDAGSDASAGTSGADTAADTAANTVNGADVAALPAGSVRLKAEVWADNWFALYGGEVLAGEDSVPITTERSFNSETFTFEATYPFELNLIAKDFKENDTGLEYIGTPKQQMGDGGVIFQITEVETGRVVAVSNAGMRCLVSHKAPLNTSCEKDADPAATCESQILDEPTGWTAAGFDASAWPAATVYTESDVGVKDGYLTISWDPSARLIWGSDLKADNTLLCKLTVTGQ